MYDELGVAPTATAAELRAAYRRLARLHHPDTTAGDPERMARLNDAWRVLADPSRRAAYDTALRSGSADGAATTVEDRRAEADEATDADYAARLRGPLRNPLRSYVDRPRFPWKLVLGIIVFGAVGILVFGSVTRPAREPPVTNLISPGSCVDIDPVRQEVFRVACNGGHDAVVRSIVEFDAPCPSGTEGYRDRQGLGDACVVRVAP